MAMTASAATTARARRRWRQVTRRGGGPDMAADCTLAREGPEAYSLCVPFQAAPSIASPWRRTHERCFRGTLDPPGRRSHLHDLPARGARPPGPPHREAPLLHADPPREPPAH